MSRCTFSVGATSQLRRSVSRLRSRSYRRWVVVAVGKPLLPEMEMMKPVIPEKGHKQLRKGRFSQRGSFYFVTVCCRDGRKVFTAPTTVQPVFDCLDWLSKNRWIELHCCMVMPDHVHFVFRLVGKRTLSQVMKSFKQFTARRLNQQAGTRGPVWQRQFYDHLVRSDESLREIVRYCWFNPVRAGLAKDPKDYPYWRSRYVIEV